MSKTGNLSINSENIFPIIKKWLYSDHDIFVRELVSNGCDAITKLKKLEAMGQYTFPDNYKAKIEVICDPDAKTLKFIDNGLGMDEDEVEKYITQIAFSGRVFCFFFVVFEAIKLPLFHSGTQCHLENCCFILSIIAHFPGKVKVQKTAEEAGGTAGTDGGCQADGFHAGHRQEEAKDEGSRTSSDGA